MSYPPSYNDHDDEDHGADDDDEDANDVNDYDNDYDNNDDDDNKDAIQKIGMVTMNIFQILNKEDISLHKNRDSIREVLL